uniref:Uncharacterized protein n=1 Tax=Magallana gigas TaxID=29159 RepID=A0A8W8NVC0_MAGGI
MSVCDLHADVEYLEGEINRLSREIHDSLRFTNSPGRGRRPRPGMSTSTPYVRRRDSVSGYVSGDVCMCDDEDPVPSDRPPVQNNANPRTRGVVRKRTAPSPVFSSRRTNLGVVEETVSKKSVEFGIQTDNLDPVLSKIMVDEATQTEGYHRRVKEITITKYHENGQKIKRIKESEELFDL